MSGVVGVVGNAISVKFGLGGVGTGSKSGPESAVPRPNNGSKSDKITAWRNLFPRCPSSLAPRQMAARQSGMGFVRGGCWLARSHRRSQVKEMIHNP